MLMTNQTLSASAKQEPCGNRKKKNIKKRLKMRSRYDNIPHVKGHNDGRSDRVVRQTLHGECRATVNSNAYRHGKDRRYDGDSIPVPTGIFKQILPSVQLAVCK